MTSRTLITLILCAISTTFLAASAITTPFRLVGKLIVIQATVDDIKGYFILDTGTPNLVLNEKYYDGRATDRTFRGLNGTIRKVEVSRSTVKIEDYTWKDIDAEIISLETIERAKGIPIHGLIGWKLFEELELIIDFPSRKLVFQPLKNHNENASADRAMASDDVLSFKCNNRNMLIIQAKIGELDLNVVFDTGAEINLFHKNLERKLQNHLLEKSTKKLSGFGTGAPQKKTMAKIDHLQIGKNDCQPMQTLFVALENATGPFVDGVIGYEFISQFRLSINFKKQEIYLWDKSSAEEVLLASRGE